MTALAGLALRLVYPVAVVLLGRQRSAAAAVLVALSVALAGLAAGASSRAVRALRPVIFGALASAARRQPVAYGASSAQVESDIARGAPWVEAYFARTLPALASSVLALPIIGLLAIAEVGFAPAAIGGLTVGIAFGLSMVGVRRALIAGRVSLDSYQRIARMIEHGVRGAAELQVHGLGARYEQTVLRRVGEWTRLERRGVAIGAVSAWSVPAVTVLCAAVLVMASGRRDLLQGAIAHPGRSAVVGGLIAISAFPVLIVLARSLMQVASQRASMDLLRDFVDRALPDRPAVALPGAIGRVRLHNVVLRRGALAGEPEVEIAADFDWPAGTSLALAGPTGAGKTSVIQMMVGLVTPTSGTVEVEVAGQADTPAALVGNVAYVPQQAYFDDAESIGDAMRFMVPDASDEQMRGALDKLASHRQQALLDLDRPMGSLSVGERRIVAIARALMKESLLVIIDEPEMNLDRETRAAVAQALREQKVKHRLLLATHDPGLAGVADVVLELDGHAVRAPADLSAPRSRAATAS